jgi:hypothetical protein
MQPTQILLDVLKYEFTLRQVVLQIRRFRSTKRRPLPAGSNSPTDVCLTALLKGGKTEPRARRSSDRKLGYTALLPFVHSTSGKSCHLQRDTRSFMANFTTRNELTVPFSNFLLRIGYVMHHQFNIKNSKLCPHCIYLRTNSKFHLVQYALIGFYNRDEWCLLRGTN